MIAENRQIYNQCIQKQLEELDLLSSIFYKPGELHIYDPSVISDFNEYLKDQTSEINSELDLSVYFDYNDNKVDIRIQLPNLYPDIEHAKVTLITPLLSKGRERHAQQKIANFIHSLNTGEEYLYQLVQWIKDEFENFLSSSSNLENDECHPVSNDLSTLEKRLDLERLWIYAHHIKSKTKRREIVNQAKQLNLTGFCKPGKPGIMCVEGLKENTQEFWRIIRCMQWHKITLKHAEFKRRDVDKVQEWRRFPDFKEKLMDDGDSETEAERMDMSLFMKFLEKHKCGYMKQTLFGFE